MTVQDDDMQLLMQFENLDLPPEQFGHREHLRLAWTMLMRWPLHRAMDRLVRGLKRFVSHHGAADRYHETITLFYLFEIDRRLAEQGKAETWHRFLDANPDLAGPQRDFLRRHYPADVLQSDVAREHFVPPARTSSTASRH